MKSEDAFLCAWFKKLCDDLRATDHAVHWFDGGSAGKMLLEVLLDASNELCASSFLATHLRRFGRGYYRDDADRWFWVRSEWEKFDLSYGLAFCEFEKWNDAWAIGDTGDLGAIELKVMYEHFPTGMQHAKILKLYSQLVSRREKIVEWRSKRNCERKLTPPAFRGLVLFLSEKGTEIPNAIAKATDCPKLLQVGKWESVAEASDSEMKTLWPCKEMWKTWELRLGLFQLTTD